MIDFAFQCVLVFLLFAIWGALGKLAEHIGALRRIAEARYRNEPYQDTSYKYKS